MSPDEIQKLLGGYATGTLTEAERKALFAAALDDQDLFDELGREQSLKEMLDVPGTRTRLAAVLTPAPVLRWWSRPLPWAVAGTLAAGILIVLTLSRYPRPEVANIQQSQLQTQAKLDQPIAPPQALSEPARSPAPAENRAAGRATETRRRESVNGAPFILPPPAPKPAGSPPPPTTQARESVVPQQPVKALDEVKPLELSKEEAFKQDALKKEADAAGPGRADKSLADEKDASPPQPTKAQGGQAGALGGFVGQQQNAVNSVSPAPRAAPAVAPRAIARSGTVGDLTKSRFAFDYTLLHDSVSVRPLATGFLQVTVLGAAGRQIVLQPASRMEAETSVSIAIPGGSTILMLEFSAQPPARDAVSSITTAEPFAVRRAGKAAAEKAPVSKQKSARVEESVVPPDARLSITLAVP